MNLTNAAAAQQGEVVRQSELSPSQSPDGASEPYWSKLIPCNLTEIVFLALVVLVISLHLKYLFDVRTTVPHGDEWSLLDGMFRSLDEHHVGAWVFNSRNGHFLIPGTLAYLVSLRFWSLDLAPLRLLNFPICLAAFLLTAHVINAEVRSRFLRFYLYLGACFVIFNLCFWELFSMGYMFTAVLSALFGGIGLYFIAKATQRSSKWKNHLLVGLCFLIASVLSLGAGYAATAAAIALLTFAGLKKLMLSRPIPGFGTIVYSVACALGLLAIASHPLFHLKSRMIQAVFHTMLVAGSAGSSFFDRNSLLAQNVAFVCGIILVVASLSIGFDCLTRRTPHRRLLPIFSLALVLFGLFGCIAVAVSRWNLSGGEFLSSRYTLYPSICLLGILLYFACWRVFWLTNIWCFAAAVYLLGTLKEQQTAFFRPAVYQKIEVAIRNIDNLSDEQLRATLYWRENTKGVRRVVARMRRDRLNVFRGTPDTNTAPH
ncbi:MAG: hypothetical protein QOC70_2267 [Verrucomicrobiota bacterium]|jgi:hypothetical protein